MGSLRPILCGVLLPSLVAIAFVFSNDIAVLETFNDIFEFTKLQEVSILAYVPGNHRYDADMKAFHVACSNGFFMDWFSFLPSVPSLYVGEAKVENHTLFSLITTRCDTSETRSADDESPMLVLVHDNLNDVACYNGAFEPSLLWRWMVSRATTPVATLTITYV